MIVGEWVKTSERLPDRDDLLIGYDADDNYFIGWYDPEEKTWVNRDYEVTDWFPIIAWAYIKEPGGENER